MNRLVKSDISAIIERLKEKYRPQKIILFGSAVRGKFREGSDLDFFILKDTQKPHHRRIVDIFHILRGIDRENPVDFIVFTPEELRQRVKIGDFFIKNILDEGEVLYESK